MCVQQICGKNIFFFFGQRSTHLYIDCIFLLSIFLCEIRSVATQLEQFLIEDQLFLDDANEKGNQVNEAGDDAKGTNFNSGNRNESEILANFEQQQPKHQQDEEEVLSVDSNNSAHMDKNQVVDAEQRPTVLEVNESSRNVEFQCHTKPKNCQTNHSCPHGFYGKSLNVMHNLSKVQNPEMIDVNLVVHGVDNKILNEVKRGTANLSLRSRKRHSSDDDAAASAKKKHRMNVFEADNTESEFDEFWVGRSPSSSPSGSPSTPPMPFKSHALRHSPYKIGYERNRNHFINTRKLMNPYKEQKGLFYAPYSRNYQLRSNANQHPAY